MDKKEAAETATAVPEETVTEPVKTEPVLEPKPESAHDAAWWEGKAKAMEADAKKSAKRLAELEKAEQARLEAEMSELEKEKSRADEAEKRAKAAELANLRRDVIADTGLPAAFADRLKGENKEEMEADAKVLLAAIPVKVPPKLESTNPGEPQTGETDAERRKRLGLK